MLIAINITDNLSLHVSSGLFAPKLNWMKISNTNRFFVIYMYHIYSTKSVQHLQITLCIRLTIFSLIHFFVLKYEIWDSFLNAVRQNPLLFSPSSNLVMCLVIEVETWIAFCICLRSPLSFVRMNETRQKDQTIKVFDIC